MASKAYTGGLNFLWPVKRDTNWDAIVDTSLTTISAHNHDGVNGGALLTASSLAANAVTGAKLRLANNEALRARNAANNADVDLLKLNTSNMVELPSATKFGTTQALVAAGAFTVTSNLITMSNAGAIAATVNVPTAALGGMPVLITNIGAGTWTVTLTGRPAASDVATILTSGSLMLVPIGTTTWAAIPGGGCTLA